MINFNFYSPQSIASSGLSGAGGKSNPLAKLEAGRPNAYLKKDGTLLVAFPILNIGPASALNLQVNAVTIAGEKCVVPNGFPFALGDVGPEGRAILHSAFQGKTIAPGNTYEAQIEGQYTSGQRVSFTLAFSFATPLAAPGRSAAKTVRVTVHQIKAGGSVVPPKLSNTERFEPDSQRTAPVPTDPFKDPSHKTTARMKETRVMTVPNSNVQPTNLGGANAN